MAGVHECGICGNTYDEGDRKPRVLQCGHTYCQPCLQVLVSKGSPVCPSCRRDIVSPMDELPVVFDLIPASRSGVEASENETGKDLLCRSHQEGLDFWCTECGILMCKLCLMKAHQGHKATVIVEEVLANKEILIEKRNSARKDLQEVNLSIKTLRQLKLLASKIDQLKTSPLENALYKRRSNINRNLNMLEKFASDSSSMEKRTVLECQKNDCQAYQIAVSDVQKQANGLFKDYLPDGTPWKIITGEAADRALDIMKEIDHTTTKSIVRSTDESPILCLFELLQYLAVSSGTMELELMDTVEREWPDENEWFPLQTGGDKSTDEFHCYRLRALGRAWRDLTAAPPASSASPAKVVATVNCWARTRDVGVLAVGKVAKRVNGYWPLPLEVHLVNWNCVSLPWLKCCLASLHAFAKPSLDECRVYVPAEGGWYNPNGLFPLLAELGRRYSTQHRLYLDRYLQREYDDDCKRFSEIHKVPYEWKAF